jgi:hypothetical protein
MRFVDFLAETVTNLLPHHTKLKEKHAEQVHGLLHKAYEHIGGLHGNGFKDHHDMVKNIHMWKVHHTAGHVHAAVMYKEKHGRKMVAFATDGSDKGKAALAKNLKHDIVHKKAHMEVSGPALHFLKKQIPDIHKHVMSHADVKKVNPGEKIRKAPADDPEIARHPELKKHFYQRQIGGEWHTKLALGSTGNTIK